jgi:ribosomal protein L10
LRGLWERRSKLNKEEKGLLIADLKDKFSRARAVVLTDYKGMTVAELTTLRRMLKGASLDYRVVKNTLAKIAATDTPVSAATDVFKGPVGVAIGYDDPVLVVKKILEYAKGNEKLKVTGAVVPRGAAWHAGRDDAGTGGQDGETSLCHAFQPRLRAGRTEEQEEQRRLTLPIIGMVGAELGNEKRNLTVIRRYR